MFSNLAAPMTNVAVALRIGLVIALCSNIALCSSLSVFMRNYLQGIISNNQLLTFLSLYYHATNHDFSLIFFIFSPVLPSPRGRLEIIADNVFPTIYNIVEAVRFPYIWRACVDMTFYSARNIRILGNRVQVCNTAC